MANRPAKGKGARVKLRDFFIQNMGKILESEELRTVAATSEWARRIRELRNEEGLNIVTHNDRSDLKPGQYLLTDLTPRPAFEREISKETRAFVLDRIRCAGPPQENRTLTITGGKRDCILVIPSTRQWEERMMQVICVQFVPFVTRVRPISH